MSRYENGGGYPRKTHFVKVADAPMSFTVGEVQQFRIGPDPDYACKRLCDDPNAPKAA